MSSSKICLLTHRSILTSRLVTDVSKRTLNNTPHERVSRISKQGENIMDNGYIENLWEMFKTIGDTHVVSDEQVAALNAGGANVSQGDAQLTVRIYAKAAKACSSAEEFRAVLESDEYPPIELTQEEMEFAKGGRKRRGAMSASRASSGASSGSCHGEDTSSGRSSGSCHGESR